MLELYKRIENCDPNAKNIVLTILEGDDLGEKALVSDGKLIWESASSRFFKQNKDELSVLPQKDNIVIDNVLVYCDNLGQEKRLVICGGGHVSIPVIQMGIMMGWEVTVLEDRPQFADNARRAGATEVICEPFHIGLDKVSGSNDTFFVVVTRGHRYDQVCLEKIIKKKNAYIGMIGSKLRVRKVKEQLIETGSDKEKLEKIYSPIGLDIKAETPVEIAVAIMAEIIAVKNKNIRSSGYSKELMKYILNEELYSGIKVLATIVSRKGSAPREAGTKMLILDDGRVVGTIGGGCMESDVIRHALLMIRSRNNRNSQICHVDMTGSDAEEDGMVCGGVVDVLLETVGQAD